MKDKKHTLNKVEIETEKTREKEGFEIEKNKEARKWRTRSLRRRMLPTIMAAIMAITLIPLDSKTYADTAEENLGNVKSKTQVINKSQESVDEEAIGEIENGEAIAKEVVIKSEKDLEEIEKNPGGNYVLGENIKLTKDVLKDVEFKGTLNGNGYTISGIKESLFKSIKNANVENVVIKGILAKTSIKSNVKNTGFYIESKNKQENYAPILKSEESKITGSFSLMNVEGKKVAGFILEGTGTIEDSYVSGSLRGEEVYGFGVDIDITNSYITASLEGEKRTLFSTGKKENCFYDGQINDLRDDSAKPYHTIEITSGELGNKGFKETKGNYPETINIDVMKEDGKEIAGLSVLAVTTKSNLLALDGKVAYEEEKVGEEEVKWSQTKREITAEIENEKREKTVNKFLLRSAKSTSKAKVGESTESKKTQATFPVEMERYYKVVVTGEDPEEPITHKDAIEKGYKIMYWTGDYSFTGLEWNKEYTIYSTDLKTRTEEETVKTNYGKIGGRLTIEGTYNLNEIIKAVLTESNTVKGSLYFETADSLEGSATWTTVKTSTVDENTDKEGASYQYIVTAGEATKYLRVRFESDETTGFKGGLVKATDSIIKETIKGVTIENKTEAGQFKLNDNLIASITPIAKENEVTFTWHHEGDTAPIGNGRNYTIKASDVGKKIYAKAKAKAEGDLQGEKDSDLTSEVLSIKCEMPESIKIEKLSIDDTTVALKISETKGLYKFGLKKSTEDEITVESVPARGNAVVIVPGLAAKTKYHVYAKRIGEKGYKDSDFSSEYLEIETEKENVKGDVVITGEPVFEETLNAAIINEPQGQKGNFKWYRLDGNGARIISTEKTGNSYTLKKEDIGKKIEAVYEGAEDYAGEIYTSTNTVSKKERGAPTTNLTESEKFDTAIKVQMPTNSTGDKYLVGISKTKLGVPIEVTTDEKAVEVDSGETYEILNLERDTIYYIFIRFAESETHLKSPWIKAESGLGIKTNTKPFVGTVEFEYGKNSAEPMVGQTINANIETQDIDFNYKGTWVWEKVAPITGVITPINNFVFINNKQGTSYTIPLTEIPGTKYKVTFTANLGYTETVTLTSLEVKALVLLPYEKPKANNIYMESVDDTSFKVKMIEGEGSYEFWYKEKPTIAKSLIGVFSNPLDEGYTEVKRHVNSNVDVVIGNLKRNTEYIVRVKRITDSKGLESLFSLSTDIAEVDMKSVTTKKTEIAGYALVGGTQRFNEKLTATYVEATYPGLGNGINSDIDGIWSWHRGTTEISGATNKEYTVVKEDVGQILTAKYTMPTANEFEGTVSADTRAIEKALGVSPEITKMSSAETQEGKVTINIEGNNQSGDKTYYRLQKVNAAPPEYPDASQLNKWKEVTASNIDIEKDADANDINPNEEYTIYYFRLGTETVEGSSILSKTHKTSSVSQKGKVTLTGDNIPGRNLRATLSEHNNSHGTWKWYRSAKKYGAIDSMPAIDQKSEWTELASGFSPIDNATYSELNISENLFSYYIRAEFEGNEAEGYKGAAKTKEEILIKKVYEETLTIKSSTKDGYGVPKAYSQTVITGTINNYAETGNIERDIAGFRVGSNLINSGTIGFVVSGNKFTYTLPNNKTYDGLEIYAEISKPKTIELYVNKDLTPVASDTVNSKDSTNTGMKYLAGTPISTAKDLYDFMNGTTGSNFLDRSEDAKYVLTANVNMVSENAVPYTRVRNELTYFKGVFDGDFHTIVGLKNPMLGAVVNDTGRKPAVIKNLILNAPKIETISTNTGALAAIGIWTSNSKFEKILASQGDLRSSTRASYLASSATVKDVTMGHVVVDNCATAGGILSGEHEATGLLGGVNHQVAASDYNLIINNSSTIKTNLSAKVIGGASVKMEGPGRVVGKNVLVASILNTSSSNSGGVVAIDSGTEGLVSAESNYYDSTLSPTATLSGAKKGLSKLTTELIGDRLKKEFGEEDWTYKDGYYPRQKWIAEHPVNLMFSATRGAFTSVDGNTTSDKMFNGEISGPIQIPAELQTEDYTVTSSDNMILKVGDNGTIIPIGNVGENATITIKYTEPDNTIGGSATNTYDFTVERKSIAMIPVGIKNSKSNEALTDSDKTVASGLNAPEMGDVIEATGQEGATYNWYKRGEGKTESQLIAGETSKIYTIRQEDLGQEITALAKLAGYSDTYSPYTKAVVAIIPDTPIVSNVTDSSVTLSPQNGVDGLTYEFGYLRAGENVTPIILKETSNKDGSIRVNNLQRNTSYDFYVRVAESKGAYGASSFSVATSQTTNKTNIEGAISLGANINSGAVLSMAITGAHIQTGEWEIERVDKDTGVAIGTLTPEKTANTSCEYTLSVDDVGFKIKTTYKGVGDFKGELTNTSGVIKNRAAAKPNAPVEVTGSSTSNSLTVKMATAGTYEIGYSETVTGTVMVVKNGVSTDEVEIVDLKRNKTYYIVARIAAGGSAAESEWSEATVLKTAKEVLTAPPEITGALKTDETIKLDPKNKEATGVWKLEKVKDGSILTISPSTYVVDKENVVTHKLTPRDSGYKIKGTFTGTGDFEGDVTKTTTEIVANAKFDNTSEMPSDVAVSEAKEYSFKVTAVDGSSIYQFGYLEVGKSDLSTITEIEAPVGSGIAASVGSLTRNTEYDIYVRKAAQVGYDESDWVKMPTGAKTLKTALTGSATYKKLDEFTGLPIAAIFDKAELGEIYKAEYTEGTYDVGSDANQGTWQWYADDKAILNATTDTYTITAMEGVSEISVRYIAKESSDFTSYSGVNIGVLTKPTYDAPAALPTVTAGAEEGEKGSKLTVTSGALIGLDGVYYYVQEATNSKVPKLVLASEGDKNLEEEGKWFKAKNEHTLTLKPNKEYVVYVAKLEDKTNHASGVVSQRPVKTVKEDLSKISDAVITEADNTAWKVQQEKELRIDLEKKAVEGVWQYYVSSTPAFANTWHNITAEMKGSVEEGEEPGGANTEGYSYSKVTLPVKYGNNYTFKAVFNGRGDTEGKEEYTAAKEIAGISITGHAEIDSNPTNEIFSPMKVRYVFAKAQDGIDIVDETNGTWTWYRETAVGAETYEKILRPQEKVGLEDSYTPVAGDINKKIYAVYKAEKTGIYSGKVESGKADNIEKAEQEIPEAITIKEVNGTTIKINLPKNIKTLGKTVAEPVLEYRKVGDTAWTINTAGSSWIGTGNDKLKANTEYEIRSMFLGTSEYKPSEYTADTIKVTTGNERFDRDHLKVTSTKPVVETEDKLKATFRGPGYDEGYFKILRSDGTIIGDNVDGTINGSEISVEYTAKAIDIGKNIIFQYIAKPLAETYGGHVEKNSEEVNKPKNPTKPGSPTFLTIRLNETSLKVRINSDLEYVFSESEDPISEASGRWQKLTTTETIEAEGGSEYYHIFTGLDKNTEYYLHARYAENENYRNSDEEISAKTKPWNKGLYNITYTGTDEATNSNVTQYTELDKNIILSDPFKVGYTFAGWTTAGIDTPTKGLEVLSGSSGDKSFHAHFHVNQYTANFDGNGGSDGTSVTKDYQAELGALETSTRNGYRFNGWFTEKTGGEQILESTLMPFEGATYYGQWTPLQYTANFDGNGGTNGTAIVKDYESKLGPLETPTKTDHTFIGWFTEKIGGIIVTENTLMPFEGATYYGQWKLNIYTVAFNTDGGSSVGQLSVEHGDYVLKPSDPTKAKHKFLGWFADSNLATPWDFANDKVTRNITLYASYEKLIDPVVPAPGNGGSADIGGNKNTGGQIEVDSGNLETDEQDITLTEKAPKEKEQSKAKKEFGWEWIIGIGILILGLLAWWFIILLKRRKEDDQE